LTSLSSSFTVLPSFFIFNAFFLFPCHTFPPSPTAKSTQLQLLTPCALRFFYFTRCS
jgi:hypothetical protein